MRTDRFICMLAIAAAACACNMAEMESDSPKALKPNQFLASCEGNKAKVTLNVADYSLAWDAGDQIGVFDETGADNLFTADNSGASTSFTSSGDFVVDPAKTYYAIYPYSSENSIEDGVITTVIPTVQTPRKENIPVNFAVAKNEGNELAFYNVCGLIGFEITQEDIVSVTIKANGEHEYLTGKVAVDCSSASYTVVDGLTEVTLVTKEQFAAGTYYVAVLPQSFTGMTVTMFKADGSIASVTNTAGFTLGRSHRVETGVVDAGNFADKIISITNAAELQGFLAAAESYVAEDVVTLANDIDLSGYDIVPAASFAGTFDGKGKKITNWNATTALFNETSGTVQNLIIDETCNLEVQPTGNAAFITLANSGTITGCVNNGTVTSVKESFTSTEARMIGTIAAVSTGTITSCTNNGAITLNPASINMAATQFVGGIVGQAYGASATAEIISDCTNNGTLNFIPTSFSCKLFIGGVCGGTLAGAGSFTDYGVIKNSKNLNALLLTSSQMSSKDTYINFGGVVGYAEADLEGCENEGAVTVDLPKNPSVSAENFEKPAVGGVAGTVLYNISNCSNNAPVSITGAFAAGGENQEGSGQYNAVSFGGVVAMSGQNNTHKVLNCINTGSLICDLDMYRDNSANGYIGGVVGYTKAMTEGCSNKGALDIRNTMRGGYVGGIAGHVGANMSTCNNEASITYDFVLTEPDGEKKATRLYLGGLVGEYDSTTNLTSSSNKAGGDILVKNGILASEPYRIGGIAGYAKGKLSQGDNTQYHQYGDITVQSSGKVYVGGLTGECGKSHIDMKMDDVNVNVTNPGTGSRIGGICGMKTGTNDARLTCQVSVSVVCAEGTEDVYVGHVYGELTAGLNLHTSVFNGRVTATNATGFGFAAGKISAASGTLQLGTGDSKQVKIRPNNAYGGTKITTDNMSDLLYGVKTGDGFNVTTTYCVIE